MSIAPNAQVITVRPDGSIAGLQVKPGKGVDLRKLGDAVIERASDISFCPTEQRWFVQFLRAGDLSGSRLQAPLLVSARGGPAGGAEGTVYFDDYDQAVQAEIDVFNHLRLTGRVV